MSRAAIGMAGFSATGGAVLAAACLVRPVGLFCVPVWLVLALWRYRWSWTVLACAAAVLVPLLGYAAANEGATGNFALTEDTAWLLYGRIGPIGDCSGVSIPQSDRVLCPHSSQLRRSVNFYLFSPSSPAVRAFGPHLVDAPARVDRILFGYSLRVMAQRPLRYTGLVAGDLVRFFVPGARSDYPTEDGPITLPRPGPWLWPVYRPRQRVPGRRTRGSRPGGRRWHGDARSQRSQRLEPGASRHLASGIGQRFCQSDRCATRSMQSLLSASERCGAPG